MDMAAATPIDHATHAAYQAREFLLDNAGRCWVVRKGTVDLFAIEEHSGIRHHIRRIGVGEALFGLAIPAHAGIRLVACLGTCVQLEPTASAEVITQARRWAEGLLSAVNIEVDRPVNSLVDLASVHEHAIHHLAEQFRKRNRLDLARLSRKSVLTQTRLHQSLKNLSRSENAPCQGTPVFCHGDSILAVAHTVAAQLRVRLTVSGELPDDHDVAINRIAQESGIHSRRVSLSGRWWEQDGGPIIGFRSGRPVALLPCGPRRYRLLDGAGGASIRVSAAVAQSLDTRAYILYRPLPSGSIGLETLLRFCLCGCGPDVVRLLTTGFIVSFLGLVLPALTAFLFDFVVPGAERHQLWMVVGILTISAICVALITYAGNVALQRIESRAGAALQIALWDRLLRLPPRFFRGFNATDLALRSLGVDQIRQILAGPALPTAMASALSIFQVGMLVRFGGILAAPAIIFLALALAASLLLGLWQVRRQRALAQVQSSVSEEVFQFVSGISKLRTAGAETRAFALWADSYSRQRAAAQATRKITNAMAVLSAALPVAGTTLLVAGAGQFMHVRGGNLGVGAFLAFSATFHQLLMATVQLGSSLVALAGVVPLFERMRPILTAGVEKPRGAADPGKLSGAIDVQGLTFRYNPEGPIVLNEVSFRIEAGEFVAFVGVSGSGKSTLLRLLLGFESPNSGSVRFDGRDLASLDVNAVRRQIGAVLQNGRLLAGDLCTNILGASGFDVSAAWEAARLADIAEDIEAMPMGMHTRVSSDGGGLSGGQRQRILIARALVGRPRILLLDEATSALDNRTQADVSTGIDSLQATRILVAHRLSTVRSADRIYVLHQGRIVESGTYDQLLDHGGTFSRLARRQLEGV
jgi:NHLM bacteriocin system ABC transporter ATP-binding protein